MITMRKFVTLLLLTALVITLVSTNLNVGHIGATDGGSGTTMTFNSNVTMNFGNDKETWLTNGWLLQFRNITASGNITEIRPGLWFTSFIQEGLGYLAPSPGTWYYLFEPLYLYGMTIAIQVDTVTGSGSYRNFNISQVWDMYYDVPSNYTIFPPVEAGTWIQAEQMLEQVETGYDYFVFSGVPPDDSWWEINYPSEWAKSRFHVAAAYQFAGFWYAPIDQLLSYNYTTGLYENATLTGIPADPIPNEGFGAVQLISTVEPGTDYYVSSPRSLLPETGTWWNITSPAELSDIQLHVSTSYDFAGRNYFSIDTLWNTTAGAPVVGSLTLTTPDYAISTVLATAPTVSTIGSWYNVIEGPTPDAPSYWNITAPLVLAGVTFFVDMSGEGVFHIDEVLNAAGTPGSVPVDPPVSNVTAEEFIPKIYVEVSPYAEGYPSWNFSISIKTDYIFHVWSYEFTLTWNPDALNCTSVTNGDLIAGGTATWLPGTFDNTLGELSRTGAYFSYTEPDPAPQAHGPGTLAIVNFTGVGVGISGVTFGIETRLVGVTKDGFGEKYNGIDDITGQIIEGTMVVKIIGDIQGDPSDPDPSIADGDVDWFDFGAFATAYGTSLGNPKFNPQCDFNLNGQIDWFDFGDFAFHYGETTTKYP